MLIKLLGLSLLRLPQGALLPGKKPPKSLACPPRGYGPTRWELGPIVWYLGYNLPLKGKKSGCCSVGAIWPDFKDASTFLEYITEVRPAGGPDSSMAEQLTLNQRVVGSSPTRGIPSILPKHRLLIMPFATNRCRCR